MGGQVGGAYAKFQVWRDGTVDPECEWPEGEDAAARSGSPTPIYSTVIVPAMPAAR